MRKCLIVGVAVAAAAAAGGAQQGGEVRQAAWSYPVAPGRDPLVPPEALYALRDLPGVRLLSSFPVPGEPRRSRARVEIGSGTAAERRTVRVGDALGPYRVVGIESVRVLVRLDVLGTRRVLEVTPGGMESESEPAGSILPSAPGGRATNP
ncbi:MAG: hypothetical protein AB1941_05010 [Gemmatimonadota bacterium]